MTRDEAGEEARTPSAELVAEARKFPGGWIYEVDPSADPAGRVPPELIRGAWAVDESGEPTGEFLPNPNYKAPRS